MTVGVLLITHDHIGTALLNAVIKTFDKLPLTVFAVSINSDIDPFLSLTKLRKLISKLDTGDGVLVLTDLFGATPCNLAQTLQNESYVRIVSGLNLSMLIRVMNYPHLNLARLSEKALTGGREGILNCTEGSVDLNL